MNLNSGRWIVCVAVVGMICTMILIALGHNSYLNTLFISLNGLALGGGIIKSRRKGGPTNGNKDDSTISK